MNFSNESIIANEKRTLIEIYTKPSEIFFTHIVSNFILSFSELTNNTSLSG
jgi:hypothetical protein